MAVSLLIPIRVEADHSESSCHSRRSQVAMTSETLRVSWLIALLLVV